MQLRFISFGENCLKLNKDTHIPLVQKCSQEIIVSGNITVGLWRYSRGSLKGDVKRQWSTSVMLRGSAWTLA